MLEAPALFRTRYQDEFIRDFERGLNGSQLLATVNRRGTVQGSTVKFDVIDPGGEMVSKGPDGKIPRQQLGLSQVTATWEQKYAPYEFDNFDVWRGNPNSVRAAQETGLTAAARYQDQGIIDQLDTATNNMGAAATLSTKAEAQEWVETLAANDVNITPDNVFAVVTLRAWSQLGRIPEFYNADFTDVKVMDGFYSVRFKDFLGVRWIAHNGLTGRGTASAKCYLYHRQAVANMTDAPKTHIYEDNDDNTGMWHRIRQANKLCLQRGVIQYLHNDTTPLS